MFTLLTVLGSEHKALAPLDKKKNHLVLINWSLIFLHLAADFVAPALTYLFNLSITSLPLLSLLSCLKLVTPLY